MKDDIFHFLAKKPNRKYLNIKAKKPVITVLSDKLYIGRTPARFCEIIGQRSGEELSIREALDRLGANESARKVFPLAASPGAHWIHFALFSTCRQLPGREVMKRYHRFLDEKLTRSTAGVGRRLMNTEGSLKILRRQFERARSVHDIRHRIDDIETFIDKSILYRLDNLIQRGRWDETNYKKLAIIFRDAWCRQSDTLRKRNHDILVKQEKPLGVNDIDLLRIYSGYWIIRALFGIELKSIDREYGDNRIEINKTSSIIRNSARNSFYFLNRLYRHEPSLKNSLDDINDNLKCAERTGEPPLIHEYYKRQAEGRRILHGFRLIRFRQVLYQLNEAVRRGFASH